MGNIHLVCDWKNGYCPCIVKIALAERLWLTPLNNGLGVAGNHVFLVGHDYNHAHFALGSADFALFATPQLVIELLVYLHAQILKVAADVATGGSLVLTHTTSEGNDVNTI